MDIVTHALIGSATAAGVVPTHPGLAVGLVLGNVVPDLDAFSRLAGKHAFLRFHQTYTHSIGAIVAVFALAAALHGLSEPVWGQILLGLGIGMAMHILLDLTNSYGVRCLWPLSTKRFALDWIFFIDAWIIGICVVTLAAQYSVRDDEHALRILSIAFVGVLVSTCAARGMIALRARRIAARNGVSGDPLAVIPTTWSPFRFLVCRDRGDVAETFVLNAWSEHQSEPTEIPILDQSLPKTITQRREWRVMRGLSRFYHCVEQRQAENDDQVFTCQDLRIRNFETKFGTLTCRLDRNGHLHSTRWEV